MLIFFFLVAAYSSANLYFYLKFISLANTGASVDVLIGAVVLFLTLSPVLIPIYTHRGSELSVKVLSYTGYLWVAFLVPFFPLGIALDLYNIVLEYSPRIMNNDVRAMMLHPDKVFLIPLITSVLIIIYGYFEAQYVRIERLVMHTAKLPENINRIRVAQISDVHLGVIVGEKNLERIIRKTEREHPDIIVSTGDLVDGVTRHIDHLAAKLKTLEAPHGKFAVMGNHEIYGGMKKTVKFIRDAGFTLLRGEGVTVNNAVNIAGMDFSGGETSGYKNNSLKESEQDVLSKLPSGLFTLLLKHKSDVEDSSLGLFDLQLSGHSHKGQIFPMNLATMFIFSYHTGFTNLQKGSAIYTSRGTGTAGPPIRFLSTPEITIIDIMSG